MLTLRVIHTHLLLWLLAGAVGSGDYREGYDRKDFETRSEALDLTPGIPIQLTDRATPLGLPPSVHSIDEKALALGRELFFDRRLSVNGTVSCGMCHIPEQGFTQNELATPVGVEGRSVKRNAPALYNVVYLPELFFDGRETSLEQQIWAPLLAINEMANPDQGSVVRRLAGIRGYADAFAEVYADGLTADNLGDALASYQRALVSGNSRFDRWFFGGEANALNELEQQGFRVFREQGCAACHAVGREAALFTDHGYYNTGIGYQAANRERTRSMQIAPGVTIPLAEPVEVERESDDGLAERTGRDRDRWRYRVPSLRNVALTAPYMHDGSLPTLAAVIDYYERGGSADPQLDAWILPLDMDEQERRALLGFLAALNGDNVAALAADARSVQIGDTTHGG